MTASSVVPCCDSCEGSSFIMDFFKPSLQCQHSEKASNSTLMKGHFDIMDPLQNNPRIPKNPLDHSLKIAALQRYTSQNKV